jgi:uncharacterized small protein (DUF1192 family)
MQRVPEWLQADEARQRAWHEHQVLTFQDVWGAIVRPGTHVDVDTPTAEPPPPPVRPRGGRARRRGRDGRPAAWVPGTRRAIGLADDASPATQEAPAATPSAAVSNQVSDLQSQLDALQEENRRLKAELAAQRAILEAPVVAAAVLRLSQLGAEDQAPRTG